MTSVRKRLETLERSQSERGGTSKDQIVRRVLERVSDAELDLLGSAAHALAQGREFTSAECSGGSIRLHSGSGIGGGEITEWATERQRR
jgi:hypothetical protein